MSFFPGVAQGIATVRDRGGEPLLAEYWLETRYDRRTRRAELHGFLRFQAPRAQWGGERLKVEFADGTTVEAFVTNREESLFSDGVVEIEFLDGAHVRA